MCLHLVNGFCGLFSQIWHTRAGELGPGELGPGQLGLGGDGTRTAGTGEVGTVRTAGTESKTSFPFWSG